MSQESILCNFIRNVRILITENIQYDMENLIWSVLFEHFLSDIFNTKNFEVRF